MKFGEPQNPAGTNCRSSNRPSDRECSWKLTGETRLQPLGYDVSARLPGTRNHPPIFAKHSSVGLIWHE
jgi:hypothetical protein